MKLKPHLAVPLAILAIGVAVGGVLLSMRTHEMAPAVAYTRLDGTPSNIAQLKGKVVLVNFWATDCVVCVREMPQIISTHEKYKALGYDTVAVSMSYNPPAYVIDFAEKRKLPFTVAIDNTGSIARSFGNVQATPTSVLLNKRGEIVQRYVGEPDFAALHRLVEKLLAET
jgi:peroxiredoxin